MNFDEMLQAYHDGKRTIEHADRITDSMAQIIAGRLRAGSVSSSTLNALKRELRDWDMHTGRWKNR